MLEVLFRSSGFLGQSDKKPQSNLSSLRETHYA